MLAKRKSSSSATKPKRRYNRKTGTYTENYKRYKVVNGHRVRVKSAKRQAAGRRNPYMVFLKKNRAQIVREHPNASPVQIAKIAGRLYRAQK